MRKIKVLFWISILSLLFICVSNAQSNKDEEAAKQEGATKDECIQKCKEAAQFIMVKGVDEAIQLINKKDSPFIWKDSYVFLMDIKTKLIKAHPFVPEIVDNPRIIDFKDQNGKFLIHEFAYTAKKDGEGWVQYFWPKPGAKIYSFKNTFVYKVPGTNIATLAGIYEH